MNEINHNNFHEFKIQFLLNTITLNKKGYLNAFKTDNVLMFTELRFLQYDYLIKIFLDPTADLPAVISICQEICFVKELVAAHKHQSST